MPKGNIVKIAVFSFFVAIFFSLAYVFLFAEPAKTEPVQSQSAQSQTPVRLFSFRGVLAGVIEEAKEIASAVASPFSGEKKPNSQTAIQPSSDGDFSFAVLGDTQRFEVVNPNGNFQKAVKNISAANPDLVIAAGDLTGSCDNYSDCVKKHEEWKKIDAPLLSKTYAAMGNHDNVGDKGDKAWQDVFNFPANGPADYKEMAYSFDFKNSHFVFLDSDKPDQHQIDEEQRAWLDQDLAKNKKENVFVVFHEPAFPVSSKIGESLDTQASQRNALWQILDKYNVTAIFNGHEHIVSRRKIDSAVFPGARNSIYQFVFANTDSFNHDLPKTGVAEYASQIQGSYGLVKVDTKNITVETHGPDGKVLDSFAFSK